MREEIMKYLDRLIAVADAYKDIYLNPFCFEDDTDMYNKKNRISVVSAFLGIHDNETEIQLYAGAERIAEVLGIDLETAPHDDKYEEVSFKYRGVNFFQLNALD